jgi:GNAT superfamily N-acetyltransferase
VTPRIRPYDASDWVAVLELCLLAFGAGCESLQAVAGSDLEWRACVGGYLRSLTRSREKKNIFVAEVSGTVAGVVHYEVDRVSRCGRVGISAVHPARQGRGVGPALYRHVLAAMRAQGLRYATAETGGGPGHARSRRAYEKVGFKAMPVVHYFMGLERSPAAPRRRRSGQNRMTR